MLLAYYLLGSAIAGLLTSLLLYDKFFVSYLVNSIKNDKDIAEKLRQLNAYTSVDLQTLVTNTLLFIVTIFSYLGILMILSYYFDYKKDTKNGTN